MKTKLICTLFLFTLAVQTALTAGTKKNDRPIETGFRHTRGTTILSKKLYRINEVRAYRKGFLWFLHHKVQVIHYSLVITRGQEQKFFTVDDNTLKPEIRKALESVRAGDLVVLTEVTCRDYDQTQTLPGPSYVVKE